MHVGTFVERSNTYLNENEILANAGFFGVSNKSYDSRKGADLYNRYLDDVVYAEELGFDAVMLNEHHANPFTMGCVMNVEAAILARITSKIKIAVLGNPLPITDPMRLVEELAEIDMISRGRLVAGWVRGTGCESISNNVNPALNRERFNEAHDFIVRAWTEPGPWRYEGKHFHYRHVNPWALPYQKPIPECWIPGLVSPETVVWAAKHRYPYLALATSLKPTLEVWDIYADTAAKEGYQAGPENFGYLQKVALAETQEKAEELGKCYLWAGGQPAFARTEWMFPPGYNSKAATKRLATALANPETGEMAIGDIAYDAKIDIEAAKKALEVSYPTWLDSEQIIAGTPEFVTRKLKKIMETLRPGILICWNIEGTPVSHEECRTSLRLMGEEVLPELKRYAKELGITSPAEVKPGSRKLPASGKRAPVYGAGAVGGVIKPTTN